MIKQTIRNFCKRYIYDNNYHNRNWTHDINKKIIKDFKKSKEFDDIVNNIRKMVIYQISNSLDDEMDIKKKDI